MHQVKTAVSFLSAVPQFTAPDLISTAEYYRDVFGFRIAGYWDGEGVTLEPKSHPFFTILERDHVQLFFSPADRTPLRSDPDDGSYHAYFNVKGIDALADEFRANGATILDGPEDRIYGQRELVVRDCNGLILAFAEALDTNAPPDSA